MPMSNVLIEKIKKARETNVSAGSFNFTVRRPTDMEVVNMRGQQIKQGDLLQKFVIDWAGVTELDIVPGGTNEPVPFDTALFMEWVADRPDLWTPLAIAIMASYEAHQTKTEESLGKPDAG